jgi:hypothetical protein
VQGYGEQALAARSADTAVPRSEVDHSRSAPRNSRTPKGPVLLELGVGRPDKSCDPSPLASPGALGPAAARA